MRTIYFLTALAIGVTSIPASIFAQNYINPMDLIGRSNPAPTNNSATMRALRNLQTQGALANQRARHQRDLQRQNLE